MNTHMTDSSLWPIEWKKVHYKHYPRFKSIQLPKTKLKKNIYLKHVLISRKSERLFTNRSITLNQISMLLKYSCGNKESTINELGDFTRFYPSAGGRYPLEIYLATSNISNLNPGLYHYNVKKHELEILLEKNTIYNISSFCGQEWIKQSNAILIISSIFERNKIKYGERGYRYACFEAGHIAQNIYLIATGQKLKCCAIGGFLDNKINNLIDIDKYQEAVIYMIAIGT